jgi:acetyl-CoA carboxylase biotin carboxyl carrier protein
LLDAPRAATAALGADHPQGEERIMAEIKSEMMGTVWKIVAAVGDSIDEEQTILILESMKMEIPIDSTVAGTLKQLLVKEGDVVQEGQVVAVVE